MGVNVHQISADEDTLLKEVLEGKIDPSWHRAEQISAHRKSRDGSLAKESLEALFQCAKDPGKNLQYAIIEGMKAGATMGEMAGVMRMAYGEKYDPFGMVEQPI